MELNKHYEITTILRIKAEDGQINGLDSGVQHHKHPFPPSTEKRNAPLKGKEAFSTAEFIIFLTQ
jgi:hypothetical protein